MKTTIKFGGFYASIHQAIIDNYLESFFDDDEDYYQLMDYKAIHQDYIEQFIPLLEDHIKETYNIDIKLSNLSLWSPKEYNFETDEIIADIDRPYTLIDTFRTHKDFLEYLKEATKSYDGFISFYTYESAWNNKNDILPIYIFSYVIDKWQESDENYFYTLSENILIEPIYLNEEATSC
jgi:hypothetical protein